jgi:hypothetical protein
MHIKLLRSEIMAQAGVEALAPQAGITPAEEAFNNFDNFGGSESFAPTTPEAPEQSLFARTMGAARFAVGNAAEFMGQQLDRLSDIQMPEFHMPRKTLAVVTGGALAVMGALGLAEGASAKGHKAKGITPAQILGYMKRSATSSPGSDPYYGYLSPTTLKFKSHCGDRKYGFKTWEDSPTRVGNAPCDRLMPRINIEGDHSDNGMKYESRVNSLGNRILQSYGYAGHQNAKSISGNTKTIKAVFRCPEPGTPDATASVANNEEFVSSMTVRAGKSPIVKVC